MQPVCSRSKKTSILPAPRLNRQPLPPQDWDSELQLTFEEWQRLRQIWQESEKYTDTRKSKEVRALMTWVMEKRHWDLGWKTFDAEWGEGSGYPITDDTGNLKMLRKIIREYKGGALKVRWNGRLGA